MGILDKLVDAVLPNIPVIGSLVGGLLDKKSAKKDQADANQYNEKMYWRTRTDKLFDEKQARKYARNQKQADKKYLAKLDKHEVNKEQKIHVRNTKLNQADKANERAYVEKNRAADQVMLDQFADEAVATRGVDFQKMRDEAIAAGFNPLSVLGTAGMYSTERLGQLAGREGIGGAYSGGGGGAPGHSGASAVGGYSTGGAGNGYGAAYQPALATGGFVQEAISRGIDTMFNSEASIQAQGAEASVIKQKAMQNTYSNVMEKQEFRQEFGYDLTKIAPYTPSVVVGPPSMSPGKLGPAGSDDASAAPVKPMKVFGRDFVPMSGSSDAETGETRYGEIGAELFGLANGIYDTVGNIAASNWWQGDSKKSSANNFTGDGIATKGLPGQYNPRMPKLRSPTRYAPGGGKSYKIPDWKTFNY